MSTQNAAMSDVRSCLLEALQHVVDGGDLGNADLESAVPDPLALDRAEKTAWQQLNHWIEDSSIRKRDDCYAAFKRQRIRRCISDLKANGR